MNEIDNLRVKNQEKTRFFLNIIGLILGMGISITGIVLSNVLASKKDTKETYQIMYTIAIAFCWDILIIQMICAVIQSMLILSIRAEQRKGNVTNVFIGITGCLVNKDIVRIA